MTEPLRPTRRDFLTGRAVRDGLVKKGQDVAEQTLDYLAQTGKELSHQTLNQIPKQTTSLTSKAAQLPSEALCGGYTLSLSRKIMACDFELQLNTSHEENETELGLESLDLLEKIEDQITVYRESLITRLNTNAAQKPFTLEEDLFDLLQTCQKIASETNGALDITTGPLSKIWGFTRREGKLPTRSEIEKTLSQIGYQKLELNSQDRTLRFKQAGLEINLNAIGKGFALDAAHDFLLENGITDFLYHGGRSSLIAAGAHRANPRACWDIGLRHPLFLDRPLAKFHLRDAALSTSGSGTQFFRYRGERYGHILDPQSGYPAKGVYSATVVAPTAATADALSTTFYVLGPQKTKHYITSHPEIKAVLVCPAKNEGQVLVHNFGFDPSDWTPESEDCQQSCLPKD